MNQSSTQSSLIQATCPECDAIIGFERSPLTGEIANCTDCTAELEVICTDPITLELAPEVEEDWGE